jgi:hypothetical protein
MLMGAGDFQQEVLRSVRALKRRANLDHLRNHLSRRLFRDVNRRQVAVALRTLEGKQMLSSYVDGDGHKVYRMAFKGARVLKALGPMAAI